MSDDFTSRVESAEDLGQVPWWHPTEKTPTIVGEVMEYRGAETRFGPLRGAVLKLETPAPAQESKRSDPFLAEPGEYVCVWLKETVLRNEWAKPAPGGPEPMVGERVGVKMTGKREGADGPYRTFKVFVDRAAPTANDPPVPVNGSMPKEPMTQETALAGAAHEDDDLPF